MMAELAGLFALALVAIWSGSPNTQVLLALAGALMAVLVSLLIWGFIVYMGSGFIEGIRGSRRAVAFGPTAHRRNAIDAIFAFFDRWAKRAHEPLVGAGYLFLALFLTFGFVAAVVIDLVTQFEATDIRVDLFGTAVVLSAAALALPSMVRLSIRMLRPDWLPGDTSRTADAAIADARRDRTEVEGLATAEGPLLRSPAGDEVLAYRLRGTIGGHEVDDGDAIAFRLTDETGRVGRVAADGAVLVALEAGGERLSAGDLDPAFLRERGLRGRGSVVIHRLQPGDRVRVSADFDRAGDGRSAGYRDAVSMTLSEGEQPVLIQDPR